MLFGFLCSQNKRPKVKKDAVMNDTKFWGLRMVKFENAIISLKATWIKHVYLADSVNLVNKWCHLAKKMLRVTHWEFCYKKQMSIMTFSFK